MASSSSQANRPNSDILNTLNKLSGRIQDDLTMSKTANSGEAIDGFLSKSPNSTYFIDGERNQKESIICRENNTGTKDCIKLLFSSIKLFEKMQKLDYYCALSDDMEATYIVCRKI